MPAQEYTLRSVEIQEIIGQVPPWTIRWGITVLFVVFLILLFCSYYIQYPDVLTAKAVISAKEQPFRLSWYRSGPHVHRVYVREGQWVKAGDTLLVERSLVDNATTPILSPVAGRAILLKGAEDNPRKSTMIVYPSLSQFEVQLYLPARGSGKVRPGQQVLMKLDAYPAEDFGMLAGEVASVVPVPLDDRYRVNVKLTQGLLTVESKKIPPQHVMNGSAEIVLENRNLFNRIFGSLFFR